MRAEPGERGKQREQANDSSSATPLDLRDGSVLRGIAILAIALHNYFHRLPGTPHYNEFEFDPAWFRDFLSAAQDPHHTVQASLSYFGHFGVQLFIFLSAYGLAVKYWNTPSWSRFVWSRLRKIYPTWFLAVGLYLLVLIATGGITTFLREGGGKLLLLTSTGLFTLMPGYGYPPVGPWWFLSFILQFYCIWSLLATFSRRFGAVGLVVLSVLSTGIWVAFPVKLSGYGSLRFLQTPLGHLPEISLGIAYARFGLRVGPVIALAAAFFFMLGNRWEWFWPLTYISALVLLLYAYQKSSSVLRRSKVLAWIGQISMPLFFVHGFLRKPFLALGRSGPWYVEIAAGLGFAILSLTAAYILWLLDRELRGWLGPQPGKASDPQASRH
jgi:peptidoglycan/LPS O-acetylase OafA/YrhL